MLLMSLQKLENQQNHHPNKHNSDKNKRKHEIKVRDVLESNTNASIRVDDIRVCFWYGYVSSYWTGPSSDNNYKFWTNKTNNNSNKNNKAKNLKALESNKKQVLRKRKWHRVNFLWLLAIVSNVGLARFLRANPLFL